MESESKVMSSETSEVVEQVSSSRTVQETSSSIVQESSSHIQESTSNNIESMKSLMAEGIDLGSEEFSSSTTVQKSSQSVSSSKMSSTMVSSSCADGDGEPVVSCQIEESSTTEASASCSAVETKNGEIVSSLEQSAQSKEENIR